jgi:hypothetical protein
MAFTQVNLEVVESAISPDGATWLQAPLFNGGTTGGAAISLAAVSELTLVALSSMRYIKGRLALAGAMSAQTVAWLGLSPMRM